MTAEPLTPDERRSLFTDALVPRGAVTDEIGVRLEATIRSLTDERRHLLGLLDTVTHATHECHQDPDREPERCRLCEALDEVHVLMVGPPAEPGDDDGMPF